ncbi:MAG: hypothetical protein ABSH16_05605 [Sedimentisphaerales bacterium]
MCYFISVMRFIKIIAIITIIFLPTILLGEVNDMNIKDKMIVLDKELFPSGYIVSFLVTKADNQFNDPNQGKSFNSCEATWPDDGAFAMKIIYNYEHPPVYAPPGKLDYNPIDYTKENFLIIWRAMKEYVLCTSNTNDRIVELEKLVIDPNNKVVRKGTNSELTHFPIDKPYTRYQFKYFQLPMGIGYSKRLETISSVESLPSGLIELKSIGSFEPSFHGNWDLKLDPNADYLVREAVFTRDNETTPIKIVSTSGVVKKDKITLAKRGVYKSASGFELSVEVEDINKVEGENQLFNDISSRFQKPLPKGSSITDLRGDKAKTIKVN